MSECCIRIDDSFRLLLPQDLITVGKLPFIPGPSINLGTVYRNDGSFPWTLLDPLDVGVDAGTGLSIGDINNDGLVDVVVQYGRERCRVPPQPQQEGRKHLAQGFSGWPVLKQRWSWGQSEVDLCAGHGLASETRRAHSGQSRSQWLLLLLIQRQGNYIRNGTLGEREATARSMAERLYTARLPASQEAGRTRQ